jgi:hypothetical protein
MATTIGSTPSAQDMADRLAIQDILSSHCRGLDRLEEPLLQSCYWPDAEVDYGSYKGPAPQFAALVVPALQDSYELTRHCLGNTSIAFDDCGNQARSECYVEAAHLLQGAREEMLFSGRYLDRLEKRDGQWKLLHRQVVIDWSRRQPVVDERGSEAFIDLARGGHGSADPSHTFLTPQPPPGDS